MKIVLTGGGSGGHITPLLAVAHELKQSQPDCELIYIGQHGDPLVDVPRQHSAIDMVYTVRAGKFRRYHGAGWRQLLDVPTILKNIRDVGRVLVGFVQSRRLLKKLKPDCIFIKGGFVGVPVGLAAASRHIPYVTHDSDAIPGLANRIIARWAAMHAVALPKEIYTYPAAKTITVGVPVQSEYSPVTEKTQTAYKRKIGLEAYDKVIFVTGGGLGAQRLNDAVVRAAPELLGRYPDLAIAHLAGRGKEKQVEAGYEKVLNAAQQNRVVVKDFVNDLFNYSGAADVIVTRAGATTLAEFAAQHKACIVVPNPQLTGGHQLKNAQVLAEKSAVLCVTEEQLQQKQYSETDSDPLTIAVAQLLDDPAQRQKLATQLGKIAHPNAAKQLAMVLLEQAKS